MKIAYIYDAVYPWVKGGAEKRIYELSGRLAERGHEVHCYGMKWWPDDKDIIMNGVHHHGICRAMPLYKNGKRSIMQATSFAGRVLSAGIDCDVVDCQNFPYLLVLLSKAPLQSSGGIGSSSPGMRFGATIGINIWAEKDFWAGRSRRPPPT